MVDRQSKIVDLVMLAIFSAAAAYLLASNGEKGTAFMAFAVLGLFFLAAAARTLYSYDPAARTASE